MKLLRQLNKGEAKVIAPFSKDNTAEEVNKFLLEFYKELIHKVITENLDRKKIDIFNANQLVIHYNPRNQKLYFVFYKNDADVPLIRLVENVENTSDTLTDYIIKTEMNEGDTLYGFELNHRGLLNTNQEIIRILDDLTGDETKVLF